MSILKLSTIALSIVVSTFAADVKTSRTGAVQVPHANGDCNTNKFIHEGGCAGYGTAVVELPLDAQIVAIRTYSNDGGKEGDGALHYVGAGERDYELSWAHMYPVGQKTTPTNKVVWYDYANRSENRVRSIALEVDWTE